MKNVFLFAIPIILGNVLQQLYTTVDTLVIGKYCGKTSLAAVGTSSQPVEVFLCIFLGIGSGVSILISQSIGSRDTRRMKQLCRTSVFFIYLCGVPLSILGWLASPFLLKLMGVPADTWDAALTYTRIIFSGTAGSLGYNMNAGILRGMGDSKASLLFLVASGVVNVVLDIVFVAFCKMDVSGAALATIIAMFISWCLSIWYIRRRFRELDFPVLPLHFDAEELKAILRIGLPIGLNNSLYSFGHMAMQTMINAQGSTFMAGLSVAGRITGCSNIAINALSGAATTFSGQNFGAQNIERLKKGYVKIPVVSGMVTLAFGLFFITIRMPILRVFSTDPEVLMYASRYVIISLLSQWMFAVFNGITCFVNGVGLVKYTTAVNLLMLWAVRIPSGYLIMKFFDGTFIMLCFPISFAFGMFCMIGYYLFSPKWKAVIQQKPNP
ncbi:MAG: MATE family efflux transporter [Blautia sp.]|nr:MATE family efflux transporter [Blautia sp.]MCM1200896.1 MATE family efflux transporter [Bacteroides fragilis]